MDDQIVNKCSCGIEYTLDGFRGLEYVGMQIMSDGGLPSKYEVRNCECGSSRLIGLDDKGDFYAE